MSNGSDLEGMILMTLDETDEIKDSGEFVKGKGEGGEDIDHNEIIGVIKSLQGHELINVKVNNNIYIIKYIIYI